MRSCCARYDHPEYYHVHAGNIFPEIEGHAVLMSITYVGLIFFANIHNLLMSSHEISKFQKILSVLVLDATCIGLLSLATCEAVIRLAIGLLLLPSATFACLCLGHRHEFTRILLIPLISSLFSLLQGPAALSTFYDITTKHSNVRPDQIFYGRYFRLER